jgi:hypothetical protein
MRNGGGNFGDGPAGVSAIAKTQLSAQKCCKKVSEEDTNPCALL